MTYHLIIPTLCLVSAFCSLYLKKKLLQIANSLNNLLFIGEAKTQKLIAEPKIIVSQDFKTTFLKPKYNLHEKHTVHNNP